MIVALGLFRPKQIANGIWRASNPELLRKRGALWKEGPLPLFLTAWWLLWLVSKVRMPLARSGNRCRRPQRHLEWTSRAR